MVPSKQTYHPPFDNVILYITWLHGLSKETMDGVRHFAKKCVPRLSLSQSFTDFPLDFEGALSAYKPNKERLLKKHENVAED